MKTSEIKKQVRDAYARIVTNQSSCCGGSICCEPATSQEVSAGSGYTQEQMASVPEGTNLGLGCGNPVAIASLQEGETVLDLGCGAGFDCFLAAGRVGPKGRVIGVDMTPEMLDRARDHAQQGRYGNVEFRLGEIENLPAADNCIDVVMSNCVINLSTDKARVFKEAYRVLKPGGRIIISDIVISKPLPECIKQSIASYVDCVSGAMLKASYLGLIEQAGFKAVRLVRESNVSFDLLLNDPVARAVIEENKLTSAEVEGMEASIMSITVIASKIEGGG